MTLGKDVMKEERRVFVNQIYIKKGLRRTYAKGQQLTFAKIQQRALNQSASEAWGSGIYRYCLRLADLAREMIYRELRSRL